MHTDELVYKEASLINSRMIFSILLFGKQALLDYTVWSKSSVELPDPYFLALVSGSKMQIRIVSFPEAMYAFSINIKKTYNIKDRINVFEQIERNINNMK